MFTRACEVGNKHTMTSICQLLCKHSSRPTPATQALLRIRLHNSPYVAQVVHPQSITTEAASSTAGHNRLRTAASATRPKCISWRSRCLGCGGINAALANPWAGDQSLIESAEPLAALLVSFYAVSRPLELSLQSSLQLSLTVLVCYWSRGYI